MAEENFEDDNDDFNTPHLPERYHQTVRAKKQQRLKKRILMAVAAIIVLVVLYSLISWAAAGLLSSMGSQPPAGQVAAVPSPSAPATPVPATTAPMVTPITGSTTTPQAGSPVAPLVSAERAREIADRYVIDQNHGSLPLNMSRSWLGPAASSTGSGAGQYTFVYERTYQDIPTDVDGFTVVVDAGTGEVVDYTRQWTTPEHAFLSATQVDIVRHEATFAVLQKARELYPDQADSLQIISAEIRWMNDISSGAVPRPGTIPLAWKVLFNDATIRQSSAEPAVAWVDAHTGELISFEYRH
jgi:hypothetical protein